VAGHVHDAGELDIAFGRRDPEPTTPAKTGQGSPS
jgi:hypothetical protein